MTPVTEKQVLTNRSLHSKQKKEASALVILSAEGAKDLLLWEPVCL